MTQWKPYAISLAVGLLVGIERENSKADQKALGVRTFLLLSLLGVMAGEIQSLWLAALISSFVFGLIFTSYIIQFFSQRGEVHLGLTTEFAAGIVFIAGLIAHGSPVIAATIGPVVALILFSKVTLHRFTREIKPLELKTAITILLIAAVVVDLVPDATIDPWRLLNPRKFGYLVLTLAILEFSSYILLKVFGEKKGSLVVGFLGGLVSSTAVLLSSAKQSKIRTESWRTFLCTVLVAQLASLIELLVIVYLISQKLLMSVIPAVMAGVIFCGICLALLWRKQVPQISELTLKSPLDWREVFRLSVIFAVLLAMVSSAERWLGNDVIFILSFLSGLFELQGISLANATLFSQDLVNIEVASRSILLAVIASLFAKILTSWFLTQDKFAFFLTSIFIPMIAIILFLGW